MRIVFFSSTETGYKCCESLIKKNIAEVVGIFTVPKSFRISYSTDLVHNVSYKDFQPLGQEGGIPVIEVTRDLSSYCDQLATFQPDFLLVFGWYHKIPKSMREMAPTGCAGIHYSLLPKYRGGAPLVWAIINGEKKAGVTFFHFTDNMDDGDIIAQQSFQVEENDTIRDALIKAEEISISLIEEFIPKIAKGIAPNIAQDHQKATVMPQRKPEDGEIDWSWDTERIRNFIRAQTKPYPGAFTYVGKKKVTIWDANIKNI